MMIMPVLTITAKTETATMLLAVVMVLAMTMMEMRMRFTPHGAWRLSDGEELEADEAYCAARKVAQEGRECLELSMNFDIEVESDSVLILDPQNEFKAIKIDSKW